jgi:hypothetical protein
MFPDNIELSLQEVAFQKLLQEENKRAEQEKSYRIEGNKSDDTTPWLRFMQWPKTFHGKDLTVKEIDVITND